MTPEERKIDDLIDTLVVAQNTAVLTVQEANPFTSNVELVPIANELLDRLKAEAKASLLQMLVEARINEVEQFGHEIIKRNKGLISMECGLSNRQLEVLFNIQNERLAKLNPKEKES